jgi:hypothetical protein
MIARSVAPLGSSIDGICSAPFSTTTMYAVLSCSVMSAASLRVRVRQCEFRAVSTHHDTTGWLAARTSLKCSKSVTTHCGTLNILQGAAGKSRGQVPH